MIKSTQSRYKGTPPPLSVEVDGGYDPLDTQGGLWTSTVPPRSSLGHRLLCYNQGDSVGASSEIKWPIWVISRCNIEANTQTDALVPWGDQ